MVQFQECPSLGPVWCCVAWCGVTMYGKVRNKIGINEDCIF
jgi:hypothetical protein